MDVLSVVGPGGDAVAGANRQLQIFGNSEGSAAQRFVNVTGHAFGLILARLVQQDDELVASVAEDGIDGKHEGAEGLAEFGEETAADQVPVGVVDCFEAIQIDEDEAERSAGQTGGFALLAEEAVELALVEEAGTVIGDGELLNAFDGSGVFDSDRGIVAEQMQERDDIVAEGFQAAVEELNDAEGALMGAQRHTDGGADVKARPGPRLHEARMILCFGDDDGLTVLGDPTGKTVAERDTDIAEIGFGVADNDSIEEILARLIHDEKGPLFGLEVLLHLKHDGVKDGVEVELGGERARNIVKDEEIPHLWSERGSGFTPHGCACWAYCNLG